MAYKSGGKPLEFTRSDVRAVYTAYSLLKVRVKGYRMRCLAILSQCGSSIAKVPSNRATALGNPAAAKVQALERLEKNYLEALTIVWCIAECLQAMGKEYKRIFSLHFEKGLSVREIGEKTGIAKSTVHRRINKTLDVIGYWLTREADAEQAAKNLLKTL